MSGQLTSHQRGAGPPVLLLNGLAMTLAGWGAFATRLEARCRVVRCDFRGQRLTPGPARADLAAHALDVVQLLDDLGLPAVHVAGTSYGGFVATLLAARWPARVLSLAVFAGAARVDDTIERAAATWRAAALDVIERGADRRLVFDRIAESNIAPGFRSAHAEELERLRELAAEDDDAWFAGLVELIDTLHGLDLTPLADRVRCAALVVAGEQDALTPPAAAEALARRILGCEFAVLPRAGHALVLEQPDRLANIYLDFLARRADLPAAKS